MKNDSIPATELICFCSGTTKGQIQELIADGMDNLEKIAQQTGAGTGCGSCDYLIAELLDEHENPPE